MGELTNEKAYVRILSFFKMTRRRLRLVKINRNLLVYLIFLGVAIGFWCLQTLKETSTQTLDFRFEVTGTPKNIIFTSDVPPIIKVNVSGRGFDFVEHYTQTKGDVISIPFENFKREKGKATIDAATFRRIAQRKLGTYLTVQSCSPAGTDIYYCTGKKKRVPVYFGGKVQVGLQHVLCNVIVSPDSIDIYAPKHLCDSIKEVYTDHPFYKNVEDTVTHRLAIKHIQGVKLVPDSVDVKICVDLFTEKEVSVPILCENIPENKVLRTFPVKLNVSFHVSATMFNKIKASDFLLVVDYNTIKKGDEKCHVILRDKPAGVSHVQLSQEYVEYVIEQAD